MLQEKEHLRRQIEATDRQIDQLVYELYGLSDEEIRVVDGSESLSAADVPHPHLRVGHEQRSCTRGEHAAQFTH